MNTLWLLALFLAEPQVLHPPPDVSNKALIVKARTILERLQTPAEPVNVRPFHFHERAVVDLAAFVKPFFTEEGVAPTATPQQSDLKTQ